MLLGKWNCVLLRSEEVEGSRERGINDKDREGLGLGRWVDGMKEWWGKLYGNLWGI